MGLEATQDDAGRHLHQGVEFRDSETSSLSVHPRPPTLKPSTTRPYRWASEMGQSVNTEESAQEPTKHAARWLERRFAPGVRTSASIEDVDIWYPPLIRAYGKPSGHLDGVSIRASAQEAIETAQDGVGEQVPIEQRLGVQLDPRIREAFLELAGSGYAPNGFDSTTYFDEMSSQYGDHD